MNETDLDLLVNAISTPTCVEKLMLLVTTLYLMATIFIFLENRRMAKAAIIASNVSLLDERFGILDRIRVLNSSSADREVKDITIRVKILFPRHIYEKFRHLKMAYKEEIETAANYYQIIRGIEDKVFHEIQLSRFHSLEGAIERYNETDNEDEKDEVSKIVVKAKELIDMAQNQWQDPFAVRRELESKKKNALRLHSALLEAIERYMWLSIDA